MWENLEPPEYIENPYEDYDKELLDDDDDGVEWSRDAAQDDNRPCACSECNSGRVDAATRSAIDFVMTALNFPK